MRHFTLAIAAATMLGLGAAQAAQPAFKGHQPGAREHLRPTAHHILAQAASQPVRAHVILAEGDGSGADVRANRHTA